MPMEDFTFAASLVTPIGTLLVNNKAQASGAFMLDALQCAGGVESIRAEKYSIPAADGSYLRKRFTAGYILHLVMDLYQPGEPPSFKPACSTLGAPTSPTATSMTDTLSRHLRSILNGGGRFIWTPSVPGAAPRLLDDLWLLSPPVPTISPSKTTIAFDLDTRFPYAIDFTQIVTSFDSADPTETLTNIGTAPFWPVWKIYGPCNGFTIVNDTTDEVIVGDKDLPGASAIPGGSYLEIDTFRNTAYLNGDGANYLPFIDVEESTFFALAVGANDIIIEDDGSGGGRS